MRFACFDRWNEPKPDPTGVTEAKWTSGVDGTRSLELTRVGETNVGKGDRIVFTDPRGHLQETIVVSPEHRREDTRIITSLVCKGGIQELDDTFIEDKRNRSATATQCLRKALEGTRWTIGMVDDAGTLADLGFYHISALEAVESIAAKYGLEITSGYLMDPQHQRITDRAVNLVKAQGDQSNEGLRRFEYGHDLKGVTRTVDAIGVKTRLYGYGKGLPTTDENGEQTGGYGRRIDFSDINDGKPYVEDPEATKLWGLPGPAETSVGTNMLKGRVRAHLRRRMAVQPERGVPRRVGKEGRRYYAVRRQGHAAHGHRHQHVRHQRHLRSRHRQGRHPIPAHHENPRHGRRHRQGSDHAGRDRVPIQRHHPHQSGEHGRMGEEHMAVHHPRQMHHDPHPHRKPHRPHVRGRRNPRLGGDDHDPPR